MIFFFYDCITCHVHRDYKCSYGLSRSLKNQDLSHLCLYESKYFQNKIGLSSLESTNTNAEMKKSFFDQKTVSHQSGNILKYGSTYGIEYTIEERRIDMVGLTDGWSLVLICVVVSGVVVAKFSKNLWKKMTKKEKENKIHQALLTYQAAQFI